MLHHRLRAASGARDSGGGGGIPTDYVARYLFNGDYTDETGNYDGANSGSTFVGAGNGPGGTNFGISTGGGSYVSLPTSMVAALGSGSGTISFAVRSLNNGNPDNILSLANTTNNSDGYIVQVYNDITPRVLHDFVDIMESDANISTNTWQHVIVRTDGSSTSFRVDGVNTTTTTTSGTDQGQWFGDVGAYNTLDIGKINRSLPINGAVFEVALLTLYDRELSDAECAELEGEY